MNTTRHHVVGVYQDRNAASEAYESLLAAGLSDKELNFIVRNDDDQSAEGESAEESAEVQQGVLRGALGGGAAGGAAGGLVGLLAGAAVLAIPGVGPIAGLGLWISSLGGAATGAVAGGMVGSFRNAWDMQYRDAIAEGQIIVGVETDDEVSARTAVKVLTDSGSIRVDHFDAQGERVQLT